MGFPLSEIFHNLITPEIKGAAFCVQSDLNHMLVMIREVLTDRETPGRVKNSWIPGTPVLKDPQYRRLADNVVDEILMPYFVHEFANDQLAQQRQMLINLQRTFKKLETSYEGKIVLTFPNAQRDTKIWLGENGKICRVDKKSSYQFDPENMKACDLQHHGIIGDIYSLIRSNYAVWSTVNANKKTFC